MKSIGMFFWHFTTKRWKNWLFFQFSQYFSWSFLRCITYLLSRLLWSSVFIIYSAFWVYVFIVISQLAANGEKTSTIISRLKVHLRTVQRIVNQWKRSGKHWYEKEIRPPPSVNNTIIRKIIKKGIVKNHGISMNSIEKRLVQSTIINVSRLSLKILSDPVVIVFTICSICQKMPKGKD